MCRRNYPDFKKSSERQVSQQINHSKPDHKKWSIWFIITTRISRKRQNGLQQPLGAWIVDYVQ
jgi:hypothetical protein